MRRIEDKMQMTREPRSASWTVKRCRPNHTLLFDNDQEVRTIVLQQLSLTCAADEIVGLMLGQLLSASKGSAAEKLQAWANYHPVGVYAETISVQKIVLC